MARALSWRLTAVCAHTRKSRAMAGRKDSDVRKECDVNFDRRLLLKTDNNYDHLKVIKKALNRFLCSVMFNGVGVWFYARLTTGVSLILVVQLFCH